MTAKLNPQEADPSRAYKLIETRLTRLESGLGTILAVGNVSCSSSTTTTAVVVAGLSSTDSVHIDPANSGAASLDGWAYVSAIAAGQFSITHASSTLARTYRWFAIRPPL